MFDVSDGGGVTLEVARHANGSDGNLRGKCHGVCDICFRRVVTIMTRLVTCVLGLFFCLVSARALSEMVLSVGS